MLHVYSVAISILITVVTANSALAICGDVDGSGTVTVTDALMTLRAATGLGGEIVCLCDDCDGATVARAPGHCADLTGDRAMTVRDALGILLSAVGASAAVCTCDACMEGATTTTSTTLPCPTADALDGRVYTRKTLCNVSTAFCFQRLVTDEIRFDHLGGGEYAVRRVVDDTTLHVGTWDCTNFKTPGFYRWTFQDETRFSANGAYCNVTGAQAPAIPPDPPRPLRCPILF
jgi:hypothetical protein